MQCGPWRAFPNLRKRKKPDLAMHPMMAINDPPPGITANCHFKYFCRAGDIGVAPKS